MCVIARFLRIVRSLRGVGELCIGTFCAVVASKSIPQFTYVLLVDSIYSVGYRMHGWLLVAVVNIDRIGPFSGYKTGAALFCELPGVCLVDMFVNGRCMMRL